MKITIRQAFDEHEHIDINFFHVTYCERCGRAYREKDEEYGFMGNKADFEEKYIIPGADYSGTLDYDSEIEGGGDSLWFLGRDYFQYWHECEHGQEGFCPKCEKAI